METPKYAGSVTLVPERIRAVVQPDIGGGMAVVETESGSTTMTPKSNAKVGRTTKVPYMSGQGTVSRGGGDLVPSEMRFNQNVGQDLVLGTGLNPAVAGLAIDVTVNSRTGKLLRRLNAEPLANVAGYITTLKVAGKSLFVSKKGSKFPLSAFAPSYPQPMNDLNMYTPPAVDIDIQGAFLANDQLSAAFTTDDAPAGRRQAYEGSDYAGDIDFLFGFDSALNVANGATFTLSGDMARSSAILGQLVLQFSDNAAKTLIGPAGVTVDDVQVAGTPLYSNGLSVPAGVFDASTRDPRGAFIGKRITSGQQVVITGTNNTGAAIDVHGGVFCVRRP